MAGLVSPDFRLIATSHSLLDSGGSQLSGDASQAAMILLQLTLQYCGTDESVPGIRTLQLKLLPHELFSMVSTLQGLADTLTDICVATLGNE